MAQFESCKQRDAELNSFVSAVSPESIGANDQARNTGAMLSRSVQDYMQTVKEPINGSSATNFIDRLNATRATMKNVIESAPESQLQNTLAEANKALLPDLKLVSYKDAVLLAARDDKGFHLASPVKGSVDCRVDDYGFQTINRRAEDSQFELIRRNSSEHPRAKR